ncbi:carboxymuconolactone decarboxylase family protein [Galenea microaerophila]
MNESQQKLLEINELITNLKKELPDEINAFMHFAQQTEKAGAIQTKDKALINVALAVSAQCEWCITLHVKNAIDAGATEQEVLEAAMQAVLMHGGPALMYIIQVKHAIANLTQ